MLMVTTPMRLGAKPVSTDAASSLENVQLTWSTGFIATPRVLGHEFRLTANLCFARDASGILLACLPVAVFKVRFLRTQQRLICASTSSNDANHASCTAFDDLLCTRWQLHPGLTLVRVMANDSNVITRSPSQNTTIARLLLNVGHNSSFGDRS